MCSNFERTDRHTRTLWYTRLKCLNSTLLVLMKAFLYRPRFFGCVFGVNSAESGKNGLDPKPFHEDLSTLKDPPQLAVAVSMCWLKMIITYQRHPKSMRESSH